MKKLEYERVIPDNESSFKVAVFENDYFTSPLHYHPEYEVVMIEEGEGLCFCGDHVGGFSPGDIAIFGKGLPHFYLSDSRFYNKDNADKCKSVYFQFKEELLPTDYRTMPGFKRIQHLLINAERGVNFPAMGNSPLAADIRTLRQLSGFEKIMSLYEILNQLGSLNGYQMLASYEFQNNDISQNPVYQRVVSYINENYRHEITLEELAGEVCMNRSALCRRFKSIAGKTIFEFLNEFRIAYACKLIVNTDALISTIAFDCGFNNISHFNALFKSITHYTPKAYREVFSR